MLLIAGILRAVLLESVLHAVLEEMSERFAREVFGLPVDILLAPSDSYVSADHTAHFVPALASHHIHAEHISHHHDLLELSHTSLSSLDVHFGAWGYENDSNDVTHKS